MKRINKQKSLYESNLQNISFKKKPVINENSDKHIALKIIREFREICNDLSSEEEKKIDYMLLSEILIKMGFIKSHSKECDRNELALERCFLFEIWWILKGEKYDGILKRNLCLFILCLLGINWSFPKKTKGLENTLAQTLEKDVDMSPTNKRQKFDYERWTKLLLVPTDKKKQGDLWKNTQDGKNFKNSGDLEELEEFFEEMKKNREDDLKKLNFGRFNKEGEWELTKNESEKIHFLYDFFYRKRLMNEELRQTKVNWNSNTSKTNPLAKSSHLAMQQREKLLKDAVVFLEKQKIKMKIPENGEITHADLLVMQQKIKKMQLEQKYEEIDNRKYEECSFKPNLISQKNEKKDKNNKKYLDLYKLAKPSCQKKDRDLIDIEYEKSCDECTFNPDLSLTEKARKKQENFIVEIPHHQKFIDRMRKAFKEREFLSFWKEGRGCKIPKREFKIDLTQDLPNEKIKVEEKYEEVQPIIENKTSLDNKIPLLFVDVNLGMGKTERIVIFEGQSSEELADQFSNEHGLGESMKVKLKEMLDREMVGLLNKIDEASSHSSDESPLKKKK